MPDVDGRVWRACGWLARTQIKVDRFTLAGHAPARVPGSAEFSMPSGAHKDADKRIGLHCFGARAPRSIAGLGVIYVARSPTWRGSWSGEHGADRNADSPFLCAGAGSGRSYCQSSASSAGKCAAALGRKYGRRQRATMVTPQGRRLPHRSLVSCARTAARRRIQMRVRLDRLCPDPDVWQREVLPAGRPAVT
jgi:hypothetical protein